MSNKFDNLNEMCKFFERQTTKPDIIRNVSMNYIGCSKFLNLENFQKNKKKI